MAHTEGNKLIAIFMGLDWDIFDGNLVLSSDKGKSWYGKLFNEDWNALMPVVEKIGLLGHNFDLSTDMRDGISDKYCVRFYKHYSIKQWVVQRMQHNDETLINVVWQAVVQFIQWYNTQKQ